MAARQLPVRPDLAQLRRQAKELLAAVRAGEPEAIASVISFHPDERLSEPFILADAQLVLARSYGVRSWPRLKQACQVIEAIWEDRPDELRGLVLQHPYLLTEPARAVRGNWGPPMSYAANLGRDRIIAMLSGLGADDFQTAFDRACLQGRVDTARRLLEMGAKPEPGAVMGPAETQSGEGMAFLLEIGARIQDAGGDPLPPVAMVLETYCRDLSGKHRCLELFAEHGVELPDTPPMALHRGRLDLLERHVASDPLVLSQAFDHREIYPLELGCHADETLALHGTPLGGGTLLHMCVDGDDVTAARWLLARGADPNAPASLDPDGFGGHTALFGCVVSQPYRVGVRRDAGMAQLLLDHGADPSPRATLRKALRFVADESLREYPDVTPLSWGETFHDQAWVNPAAMAVIAEAGGTR